MCRCGTSRAGGGGVQSTCRARAGETAPCREVAKGPAGPERPAQRHCFDDPGAGPSHAPPAVAGDDDDLVRQFETVLRDVPEGMWIRIQDEEFLE
jgi:hypothetical protein